MLGGRPSQSRRETIWRQTDRQLARLQLFLASPLNRRGHTSVEILLCARPCAGLPSGSVVKNLSAHAGDVGLIPGPGRSPGEGNGNPLQYSCLGNPMDRGAGWATVHGVTESDMTEQPFRATFFT